MKKELKEFVCSAKLIDWKDKTKYKFKELYVINSGVKYEDIPYNNIIVIGMTEEKEFLNITNFSDILEIKNTDKYINVRVDIPRKLGCLRYFLLSDLYYFQLLYCLSECKFEVIKEEIYLRSG